MSELTKEDSQALSKIEQVLMQGNLSSLSNEERVTYYKVVCNSAGLNPFTKPFEYITLNGKLTLYATRSCTDQLRSLKQVSVKIVERTKIDGLYIVTAQASDSTGRVDESVGAVQIEGLSGEKLANAIMKGETKAKRRATLSFCGLGFLDESEVEGTINAPFKGTQANVAEAVRPQIEDTEERRNLIIKLETVVRAGGIETLAREWKEHLTPEQRKLVGAEELQRIKSITTPSDLEVAS